MTDYTVHTNANPQQLGLIAADTYKQWMEFALGHKEIGGKKLMHPSGKYAASISWQRQGTYQVVIVADDTVAPEGKWIEDGISGFSIKQKMLAKYSKINAKGERYRIIPMPPYPDKDKPNDMLNGNSLADFITKYNPNGQRVRRNIARMWGKPIKRTSFRTMRDGPGAAAWYIPDRPAYAPAKHLADLLKNQYGA